jgi:hypothetical protein
VFVVRLLGGQYREELILNVTVFVVRLLGGQYKEDSSELVSVFEQLLCCYIVRAETGR